MREMVAVGCMVFGLFFAQSGAVLADSCGDLVNQAQSALKMQGLDDQTRGDLEALLQEGLSGDPMRCTKATGSLFQSSPEGESAPRKKPQCKESERSV
jgi:hypothetical protein